MSRKTKLLAVDDEKQNTRILQEILSFYPQYLLEIALSGEEALDLVGEFCPEIILLDIMMPGMDGYEVCKQIRCREVNSYSKIIMVSGLSMIDDRLRAYEVGADDYIVKPFVEDELIAKLGVFSKLCRMEEVDDLKTTALNILSHETRTPLNGIFLGVDLLQRDGELNANSSEYISVIKTSAERIKYLVEKISRYCQLKSGVELEAFERNVKELLDEICDKYYLKRKGGDVKCVVLCDEKLRFKMDWKLMEEVLLALIDNAVKNSPKNGVVTIGVTADERYVDFYIEDQGKGVDKNLREKIFQGLFSSDILHHSSGVGLGLAISDTIISAQGGSLTCEPGYGGGARFKIRFKAQKVERKKIENF